MYDDVNTTLENLLWCIENRPDWFEKGLKRVIKKVKGENRMIKTEDKKYNVKKDKLKIAGTNSVYDYTKRFKEGRICKFEGCNTVLNIYNSSRYCSLHIRKIWERESRNLRAVKTKIK